VSAALDLSLVSTEWVSARMGDPRVAVAEAGEDPLLYDIGHIPGAVRICRAELERAPQRDVVDPSAFAELMRAKGIERDTTVVLYSEADNRPAAYALWVFTLFGHPDVRLLDGGRDAWNTEGRETSLDLPVRQRTRYPVAPRDDVGHRVLAATLNDTARGSDRATLLDVRSPEEFQGERRLAARGGHIPGARNVHWSRAVGPDGRLRPAAQLAELYADLPRDEDVVVYCHTGEQAAHTWFVLTRLLGFARVRVYDGSWSEWGNTVRPQ
jgi:thiosulfate/3-mercaptopyruvate sulfurtransferase